MKSSCSSPLHEERDQSHYQYSTESIEEIGCCKWHQLEFTDYALDYLAENGYDPQFGARPLKRLIQKEIVNQLSKRILAGDIDKSNPVLVDVFDGVVVFRNENHSGNHIPERGEKKLAKSAKK